MSPVPDGEADALSSPPPARRAAYLSALRIPLLLALAFAAALGGYYFLYVTQARSYFVARNFRLLATMSVRIDNAIESNRRTLTNLRDHGLDSPRGAEKRRMNEKEFDEIKEKATRFIPILRNVEVQKKSAAEGSVALQFVGRRSQSRWAVHEDTPGESEASLFFRIRLEALLRPLLRDQVNDKTFDLLLVAAPDGRVLYQTGGAALRITNIALLIAASDTKEGSGRTFDQLARSSSLTDIVVSGTAYTLFTQPCCGAVSEEAEGGAAGWVLCGLTAKDGLSSESYTVPFPLLGILVPTLLFAVLSWPFVKLSLIGDTQRVTAYDVALVGICALLGTAVITVCALDVYAFSSLHGRLDEQLEAFATEIRNQVTHEVEAATGQLKRLDAAVADNRLPSTPRVSDLAGLNSRVGKPYLTDEELKSHPYFESFALIRDNGRQARKMSVGSFVTPLISVSVRDYFSHWRTAEYPPVMLESIQSRTTGVREAMISKPSTVPGFEVAALAIPMRTLIDPVLVPGFAFVVIDDDGVVLFHSDPQHSLSENFFIESDNSRRLRALVAARSTEWLDIKYWADDHRAFVSPLTLGARPATLVTLYDRQLARAIHVEWLVLVLVFLLFYVGIYTAGCVAVLIARPAYRAPWLWPDPAGSRKYLDLLPVLLLLLAAFLIAVVTVAPADLLLTAWLLPFLAWALAYLILQGRCGWRQLAWPGLVVACLLMPVLLLVSRAEQPVWRFVLVLLLAGSAIQAMVCVRRRERTGIAPLAPPPNLSYGLAAALLLILVAVLPTVAFFRVGYDMQMETLVKYGQLQVSKARAERTARDHEGLVVQVPGESANRLRSLRLAAANWGVYESFFFSTQPAVDAGAGGCEGITTKSAHALTVERDALPEVMEEFLPFYSEGSVRLRELMHDRTADGAWQWSHDGRQLVFCSPAMNLAGLRSTLPGLFDWPHGWPGVELHLAWLILGSLAVLVAAIWVIRFIVYNIFVADVIEPVWTGGADVQRAAWGPNLFLIASQPVGKGMFSPAHYEIDLEQAPPKLAAWFDDQTARLQRAPADQGVLIVHFEERLDDVAFNRSKLDLIERIVKVMKRAVVVVSAVPPSAVMERDVDSTPRWSEVLSLFTIVPVTPARQPYAQSGPAPMLAEWATSGWREIAWRINALGFAHAAKFLDSERADPQVSRLWNQVLPYAWHPERTPLEMEQLLVEVGERAENHYREIWSACTPAERLALGHIAEEGLVNRKMKVTVRRLMARGLVRRQPHVLVMNETFRRFVLTVSSSAESAALEESVANPWETIRLPFLAVLAASLAVLFLTQHELLNTTLAVATGVGTAVPAIVKMASLFGQKRGS